MPTNTIPSIMSSIFSVKPMKTLSFSSGQQPYKRNFQLCQIHNDFKAEEESNKVNS